MFNRFTPTDCTSNFLHHLKGQTKFLSDIPKTLQHIRQEQLFNEKRACDKNCLI